MNWFANLKLAHKLTAGFALCIGIATAMGILGLRALGDVQRGLERVYADGGVPVSQLKKVADAYAVAIVDASHKARSGAFTMDEARASVRSARETVKEEWGAYLASNATPEEQALIDKVKPLMAKAELATDKLNGILAAKDEAALAQFCANELYPAIDPVSEGISELILLQLNVAKSEYEKGVETYASSFRATIGFLILSVGAGVLASVFITRVLRNSIDAVRRAAHGLSQGDLDQEIVVKSKDEAGETAEAMRRLIAYQRNMAQVADEYAQGDLTTVVEPKSSRDRLGSAFATMGLRLNELISGVAERADGVAATSQQLASACQEGGASATELAAGSDKLAASAAGAAAIMEKLGATITEVEQNSARQSEQADAAGQRLTQTIEAVEEALVATRHMRVIATQGGDSVNRTVSAMGQVRSQVQISVEKVADLEQSGRRIGAIVATIQGIAEQTNLLALNAAIEAARAGEHGRGFAVVAEEVRKLAEEARGATKEIGTLVEGVLSTVNATVQAIRATTEQVEAGAVASSEAGRSLEQILESVQVVAQRAESVAALSREVGGAMDRMSSSVHANRTATRMMGEAANEVGGSIGEVAAISEESAAGSEEFSASLEEVSAAASEMSALSTELQSLVGRFKLRGKAETPKIRIAA